MNFFSSLLLILSLLFPLIASTNTCSMAMCMNSNFLIKFPFYMFESSIYCYYPGFQVRCAMAAGTSLDLPYSGEFLIRNINYLTQEINIYDPKSCLAKRLIIPFNLSSSVFKSPYYVNFTFLTCPTNLVKSKYRVIDCLSNSKNTTLATTSLHLATNMSSCEIIGTFKVPVSKPGPYNDDIVSQVVNHDIHLTWDRPNCKKCEARGGMCSFDDDHNQTVCSGFSYSYEKGKAKAPQTAIIVALGITIPVLSFLFCICLYLHNAKQPRDNTTEEIITIQPPIVIPPTGLDDSTIATYPQVTLGQSKRIPGSSDGTCVICLSEFCAKEVIRVIPECKHCFHTTCIDEWLRIKGTCPVCRNSPLP